MPPTSPRRKYYYSAYEILGLENDADEERVQRRVKALRALLHPDRHAQETNGERAAAAEALFEKVLQADDSLQNKNKLKDIDLLEKYIKQGKNLEELLVKYNDVVEEANNKLEELSQENEALVAELELSRQRAKNLERQKSSGVYALFLGIALLIELLFRGVAIFYRWAHKNREVVAPWSVATGATAAALYGISILFI